VTPVYINAQWNSLPSLQDITPLTFPVFQVDSHHVMTMRNNKTYKQLEIRSVEHGICLTATSTMNE